MQKPTGNKTAPSRGEPVCTVTVTAKTAARARSAPAMNARISVSLVDMKILDSPASTIFATNSEGARQAIAINLLRGPLGPLETIARRRVPCLSVMRDLRYSAPPRSRTEGKYSGNTTRAVRDVDGW